MYFGASQYPETKGMSFKEIRSCISFCTKKEGIRTNARFVVVLAVIFSLVYVLSKYFVPLMVSVAGEYAKEVPAILVGLFFGGFLLYEVNVTVRRADKKHIEEFKHNNAHQRTT